MWFGVKFTIFLFVQFWGGKISKAPVPGVKLCFYKGSKKEVFPIGGKIDIFNKSRTIDVQIDIFGVS